MAKKFPVIISDMGGVMYSFSESFDSIEHEEIFNRNLYWYSQNEPRFAQVLEKVKQGDYEPALEVEKIAIKKWFKHSEDQGVLPIYFNIEAFKQLVENAKQYKVVIVSTSKVTTSMLILENGMELIQESALLVKELDIIDMSIFGSKKKPEDWLKIMKMYADIRVIVEDNETNLNAAFEAANSLFPNVRKSLKMELF
jgi:hypothetical protein